MTAKISVLFLVLICLISCQQEEEESINPLIGSWNLIELTGGFAGADETYDPGEIVWTFSEDSLFIQGSSMFISEGTKSYFLMEYRDSLFIDFLFNGAIPIPPTVSYLEINDDAMIIDQSNILFLSNNDTIPGAGSDGFFFSFERQ